MTNPTFQEYYDQKRTAVKNKKGEVKIPSDIASRWEDRVIRAGLHTRGFQGAEMYMDQYGRGIAAPKCILLTLKAEVETFTEMARGFWARAYELEVGVAPQMAESCGDATALSGKAAVVRRLGVVVFDETLSVFPQSLWPGHIYTMQPVDAPHSREWFTTNLRYIGQPKRDGKRQTIAVDYGVVWYQARSRNLGRPYSSEAEKALLEAYAELGAFILDGEVFYLSAAGSEHRTGAQANTANFAAGVEGVQTQGKFGIFEALYAFDKDLTITTELERIKLGEKIGQWLLDHGYGDLFEVIPAAYTETEKRALCAKQQAEGREGEVWRLASACYIGGESKNGEIYRTKYLSDVIGLVTGLTPTTAPGRLFGALEISLAGAGERLVPAGSVGGGFSIEQMREITRRFQEYPGHPVRVLLTSQGFTESGLLWQRRFVDFAEDDEALTKAPVAG